MRSSALDTDVSLEVYLPAGYDRGTDRLPVAYLHDEKTARSALRIPTVLDNLIGRRVAPLIAVFIKHQPPFFGPEPYAKMAGRELPAFIDGKYRTIRSPDARCHIGWGLGGYGTMYTVLSHPEMARRLGVQSPWILDVSYIEPVMRKASETPLTMYVDWGKYDTRSELEAWSMADMTRKLDRYFREHGTIRAEGRRTRGAALPAGRTASMTSWSSCSRCGRRVRIADPYHRLYPS